MAEGGNAEEAPPTRAEAPPRQDGAPEELSLEEQIVSAVSEGDVTKVQALLVSRRGDPNFCDKHGMTPLHHAAYKGIPQLVQLLLDQVYVFYGLSGLCDLVSFVYVLFYLYIA